MKKRFLSCILCMSLSLILTASPLYSFSSFASELDDEAIESIEESTEEAIESANEETVEDINEDVAKDTATEVLDESTDEIVDEAIMEPAQEIVEEALTETIEKVADENVEQISPSTSVDSEGIQEISSIKSDSNTSVTLPVANGADITAALKNAIKNGASGTTIVIPAGTYTLSQVNIKDTSNLSIIATGATITGSTDDTLVNCPDGSTLNAFSLTGGTWISKKRAIQLYGTSLANVSISDVTLKSKTEGIRANNLDTLDIKNTTIVSPKGFGIAIENSKNISFNNISVSGGSEDGIRLINTHNVSGSGITSSENSGIGLKVYECSGINLSNLNMNSNNGFGVNMDASSNVVLNNLTTSNNSDSGLRVVSTTNFSSNSVSSESNNGAGVLFADNKNANIGALSCNSNTSYGVNISDCSNSSIGGGQVSKNKNTGIFAKSCSRLTLSGLTVSENAPSKKANTPGHGIHVNASTVTVNDCTVNKNYWCGLSASGKKSNVTINGGSYTNNGTRPDKKKNDDSLSAGIGVYSGASVSVYNVKMSNNHGCGIAVNGDESKKINCYANIYGCAINKNGDHGIGVRPCGIVTLGKSSSGTKNTIKKNKYHGILLNQNSTIKSMKYTDVSSNGGSGMSISVKSKANKVSNCTFNSNKAQGIQAFDGGSLSISNSTISKNKGSGVRVGSGGSLNKMTKCTLKSNKLHGLEIVSAKIVKGVKSNKISGNKKGNTKK